MTLRKIPTLSTSARHYHYIHTHAASNTHPTPSVNPVNPATTPATPLPASYIKQGGVYLHWPYCRQRCTYCNFVKFIPRPGTNWTLPHDVLEDAMVEELQHSLRHSHITSVPSVFFGGGTPSLARPQLVEKVLRAIDKEGHLLEGAEVTLEANPTSLETRALRDFKEAGVNRVSIGVQSLDEATLRLLNRDHSVKEAKRCLEAARRLFPGRISVDVMFGLPHQDVQRWERELRELLALCNDHLSLYQLTVENGTALHRRVAAGDICVPDQDQMADLYTVAVEALQEAGLYRYEVSNFARCQSAESIHNKGYWQSHQYIGIGPGAHSRVVPRVRESARVRDCGTDGGTIENCENGTHSSVYSARRNSDMSVKNIPGRRPERSDIATLASQVIREARVNAADPASWLQETLKKGDGTRKIEGQTRFTAAAEYLASGLRTRDGVTAERWSVFLPHVPLEEVFGEEVGWLEDAGMVHLSSEGLTTTGKGLAVLDSILPNLYNILHKRLGY